MSEFSADDLRQLNEQQRAFCEAYIECLDLSKACQKAGYSATYGSKLFELPHVKKYVEHLQDLRVQRLAVNADAVITRLWKIATANPNNLIEYRRGCCRYCYGKDHRYQWTDAEFERAKLEARTRGWPEPQGPGGSGYDRTLPPVKECPECQGEGHGHIHAKDTRHLDEGALALYAGAKIGRDGLEIKMHDQMRALELVGRSMGIFKDKEKEGGNGEGGGPVLNLHLSGVANISTPFKVAGVTAPQAPEPATETPPTEKKDQ